MSGDRLPNTANPYSPRDCAQAWDCRVKGNGGGVWLGLRVFGHHSSWQRLRLGGNARGSFDNAGGAVGSPDLSPEAVEWVTSGDVLSQHTSELWYGPSSDSHGIGSKSSKRGAGVGSGQMTLKMTKKGKLGFEE